MAEGVATPVESVPDPPSPSPATPEEDLSLSDHETQFGPSRPDQPDRGRPESATVPVETPSADPETPESASAEAEERDDKGRFKPRRHRAESAIAGPQDVPRIQQLTARLRAAEAERDALKAQRAEPSPARDRLPSITATPPAAPSPKPTPDQFTDYGEYVEALTDWKTDQKLTAAEQRRDQAAQQAHAHAEAQRIETGFNARKVAARLKYPDFDEVALNAPTSIPAGSLVDAWVLEHQTGADVLYHLQQHPDELSTLLEQPVLEQAESLALLAQRFNGHGRTAAAATGSAPASVITPPPKPPNPVRTGPLRSGDEPPDEETASLADHETWYASRPRRRA